MLTNPKAEAMIMALYSSVMGKDDWKSAKYKMLEYRDIEIIVFPFYFFVNCLREMRNMSI
jgi:hypothetical protein